MTQPAARYRIVSRVHINKWSDELQGVIPGWDIRALWLKTGTMLPVFCPDAQFSAENVDRLIVNAGERDDSIHALGA